MIGVCCAAQLIRSLRSLRRSPVPLFCGLSDTRVAMECETKDDEEGFEVVTDHEVKEARRNEVEEKLKAEDERIDSALERLEKEGVDGLGEADLRHVQRFSFESKMSECS